MEPDKDLETLFDKLNATDVKAPAGFTFRVMNRVVSIRLRRAERQARRISLLLSLVLIATAVGGLALSFQQGWFSGEFFLRLPIQQMAVVGGGVLMLIGLDTVFETRLQAVDSSQHRT
jgi:small neutral amino acid transporter SnatA (MarC family)